MSDYIIYVKKRKFATGLVWQPVASGFNSRNYARNLSHNVNKKLNLYSEYRSMVGLAGTKFGHRFGMNVAAAEVMGALSEYSSFLAMFEVENRFYIIVVRNGIILLDKVFDTEVSARSEFSKFFDLPDWGILIAPSRFGIPHTVERDLGDLLFDGPRIVLRPMNWLRSVIFSIILFALFLILIYVFFQDPINKIKTNKDLKKINPELIQEYKRQIEIKNKELDVQYDIKKAPEIKPLVMPYNELPDPQERAKLCYRAIGFLMQPISGWNQVVAVCDENSANVQFNRGFGTLGDFYTIGGNVMTGATVQELNDNTLQVDVKLPELSHISSQDERDAETIVRDVTTIFQALKMSVNTEIVVDTITNGVDSARLNIVEIGASSKLVPMQFMEIFGNFSGVYMTRCTWNVAQRIWNYEVIIYAK